jgi:hypothetical protein
MDFFGNVQGVEVSEPETQANLGMRPNSTEEAEWREDLLALGKKIRELADTQEAADKLSREAESSTQERASEEPTSTPAQKSGQLKMRAAKVTEEGSWWGKKLIGAWVLGGLGMAWAAGSYVEAL